MVMRDKKRRRWRIKAAAPAPRLRRVRSGKKKTKKKAWSKQPVYMVLEHGVEEPTHSVIELAAGAAPRPLLDSCRGMSFAAVGSRHGPRIVGAGLHRTTVYDPKTSTEVFGPPFVYAKLDPVLISHGGKLYALSRNPAVVQGPDFMTWFIVLDLNAGYISGSSMMNTGWRDLPPPPIFPCRLNPLEYRKPPKIRVASYAVVGSYILLSVDVDTEQCEAAVDDESLLSMQRFKGTCAFDVDARQWETVDDKNLPFIGQAVPLGDHCFVACSKEKGGAAAVYYMDVFPPGNNCTGKTELSIVELPVASKGIVPGQLLCFMGKGSFSSFDIRSVDPGPEAKVDKARIVHRTYSIVNGDDARASNSVVIVKQQRQIFKLQDPSTHLASPLSVVAALTIKEQSSFATSRFFKGSDRKLTSM